MKPPSLSKKSIEIIPHKDGGFELIIRAANTILFGFSDHSAYWHCRVKMTSMIADEELFNKSTYKSIKIGRWRWVDSLTRKREWSRIDKVKKREFNYD